MKRIIIFLIFLGSAWGQGNLPGTDSIARQIREYYISIDSDTGEGGGYSEYLRWQWFVSPRISLQDSTGGHKYLKMLANAPICNTTPAPSDNWQFLGPVSNVASYGTMGIVNCIVLDPADSNIAYLGGRTTGLWKGDISQDTVVWQCLTDNTRIPVIGVTDIAVNPANPNEIYIGSGYQTDQTYYPLYLGLLKSTDGGNSWNYIASFPGISPGIPKRIIINPLNPNTVYLATRKYVFRSYDKGNTWQTLLNVPDSIASHWRLGIQDMEMFLSDTSALFVSVQGGNGKDSNYVHLYGTVNSGASWNRFFSSPDSVINYISITTTPADSSHLYIAYVKVIKINNITIKEVWIEKYDKYGIRKRKVQAASNNLRVNRHSPAFAVSPTDTNVVYLENTSRKLSRGVYDTTTGKFDFSDIMGLSVHPDQRFFRVVQGSVPGTGGIDDVILSGNDGGISLKQGNAPWVSKNGIGLGITQFYGIGLPFKGTNLIAGGTQDNSVFLFENGKWSMPMGLNGDGGEQIFSPLNDSLIYSQTWCCPQVYLNILTKNNGNWVYYPTFNPPNNNTGYIIRPMESVGNTVYIGTSGLYKSYAEKYLNWELVFQPRADRVIRSIAVCKSDTNIMFVSYQGKVEGHVPCYQKDSMFFRSIDGGKTWEDLTCLVDTAYGLQATRYFEILDIEINPNNCRDVWLSLGVYELVPTLSPPYNGKRRVIYSPDAGNTWSDYSTGLTPFPVNKVLYDKDTDVLYAATDVGVFYTRHSDFNFTGWQCYNENLPVCIVSDIELDAISKNIVAATYGRGVWYSPVDCGNKLGSSILLTNLIPESFYYADTLVSDGQVQGEVIFKAEQEVILKPGFVASIDSGADFRAFIYQCNSQPYATSQVSARFGPPPANPQKATEILPEENYPLKIYPVPTRGKIIVELPDAKTYSLKIVNFSGVELLFLQECQGKTEIDIRNFPRGIYFLEARNGTSRFYGKLIKY